jgi:DNA helicase-2/ATP-dependent DNA helicase PcrA
VADAERILDGLNEQQREAVLATTGPVLIVAGAGTGKTRVVSHRAAYAVASGIVDQRRMLLVTFTRKAADEMAERVRALGLGAVSARTFSSAALAQLTHFWPSVQPERPMPEVLADKWRLVAPLARGLPGHYRFTPTKDLIDEIEWAKSRRIPPQAYEATGREPPIPVDLFVRVYRGYERAKSRHHVIDFEDILALTVGLLESDEEARRQVHGRYAWFSVDEFQDTTPLQFRLLELWLGERRDVCVVGDDDQTIYTFAGASPEHLRRFGEWFPDGRVIELVKNYRSSPQVLSLANRLLVAAGRSKRLVPTRPSGPEPTLIGLTDDEAEIRHVIDRIRRLLSDGVPAREIAVLVRLNAQLAAWEQALSAAGIPYVVRGQRFFERREVREAIGLLRGLPTESRGPDLVEVAEARWSERLGFEPDGESRGAEARERQAALETLLAMVREEAAADGDRDRVVGALAHRAGLEAADGEGVELLTLHRAKGLEWDAVFLPALEEGLLPVAQAVDDTEALDEERRLLYVGITRARLHLTLTWAALRPSSSGRLQKRSASRFLAPLRPARAGSMSRQAARPPVARPATGPVARVQVVAGEDALLAALKAWRLDRARADGVPAYVVATDATLEAIAARRPTSDAELLAIPGIGPAKLGRYGDDILDVLTSQS